MRQVAFFWRGEGQDVRVTGTFSGWSAAGLRMQRESPALFSLLVPLPVASVVHYKFIVDGAWVVDESEAVVLDADGNQNNQLVVTAEHFVHSPARERSSSHSAASSASHSASTPGGSGSGGGGGGGRRSSIVGSPRYAAADEHQLPVPVGSILLSAEPPLDPANTSYIGAGVLREYTEEYELDAVRYGAQKRALTRSVSMSQLDRLPALPTMLRQGLAHGGGGGGGGEAATSSFHHRHSTSASAAAGAAVEGLALALGGQGGHRGSADGAPASASPSTAASSGAATPAAATAAAAAATAAAAPALAALNNSSSLGSLSVHSAERAAASSGSCGPSPGSASPREGAAGFLPAGAAPSAPPKSLRPKLSSAMNRAVGVPTSVPVGTEVSPAGLPGGGGGGGGGGGDAFFPAPAASFSAHLTARGEALAAASGGGGGSGSGGGSAAAAAAAPGAAQLQQPPAAPAAALAPLAPPSASLSPAQPALQAPLSHVQALLRVEGKLVVAMAGLPARGKTFIARHLKRHLGWMGYRTEIFNVGNYRRKHLGARQSHDFFDPLNKEGEAQRHSVAALAFSEMAAHLRADQVDVAIFDATNTTVERRQWLAASLAAAEPSCRLVFVEPICTDEAIVRSNVVETKLKSPDYKGMEEAVAVEDFLARIQHYVSVYQPLGESPLEQNVPYIKLIDLGKQFVWCVAWAGCSCSLRAGLAPRQGPCARAARPQPSSPPPSPRAPAPAAATASRATSTPASCSSSLTCTSPRAPSG